MSKRTIDADGGDAKRSKANGEEMLFLVSHECSGELIGKGGATIQQMREASGCGIQLGASDKGRHDRIMKLYGDLDAIQSGYDTVSATIASVDAAHDPAAMQLKMLVPQNKVGGLIGKAGAMINELRTSSGCDIHLAKDSPPMDECSVGLRRGESGAVLREELRVCTIKGSQELVKAAAAMILQKLKTIKATAPRKVPAGFGSPTGQGFGAGAFGGMAQPTSNVQMKVWMLVADERAGKLIGKGGSKLAEMRQASGAQIGIEKRVEGQEFRVVNITGAPEQNMIVQSLVGGKGKSKLHTQVPDAHVGRLIGKGGANIQQLRTSSGARIQIEKNESGVEAAEREVTIEGSPEQNSVAMHLIGTFLLNVKAALAAEAAGVQQPMGGMMQQMPQAAYGQQVMGYGY